MLAGLTDRQKLLIDRLVGFGDLVKARAFPMDFVEIIGFGSFFRGKPRPKDVDLLVRCNARPLRPDFAKFAQLLEKIRSEPSNQTKFKVPQEAMDDAYRRQDCPRLPGFDDGEVERNRFCEWLEGYSWNMLFPQNISDQVGVNFPEGYTKRMVKRLLPNINVLRYVMADDDSPMCGMRCGFTVSIWSTDAPEMAANLANVLTPERLRENTLRELRCFEYQCPPIKAQADMLRAEIDLLFRVLRPANPPKPMWAWHKEWLEGRAELADVQEAYGQKQAAADEFMIKEWDSPVPAEYEKLTHGTALAMTEKLRKEIKDSRESVEMLEEVQAELVFYQSGNAPTKRSAHEYVALATLSKGNARRRKAKEAFLKSLGITRPTRIADDDAWLPA